MKTILVDKRTPEQAKEEIEAILKEGDWFVDSQDLEPLPFVVIYFTEDEL